MYYRDNVMRKPINIVISDISRNAVIRRNFFFEL